MFLPFFYNLFVLIFAVDLQAPPYIPPCLPYSFIQRFLNTRLLLCTKPCHSPPQPFCPSPPPSPAPPLASKTQDVAPICQCNHALLTYSKTMCPVRPLVTSVFFFFVFLFFCVFFVGRLFCPPPPPPPPFGCGFWWCLFFFFFFMVE